MAERDYLESIGEGGGKKRLPFLTNTFSPMMLGENGSYDEDGVLIPHKATIQEIELEDVKRGIIFGFNSAVSHKITAEILSHILDTEVKFNRVNISLTNGDTVFCVIPKFRADIAREFTTQEINNDFRFFRVIIK